MAMATVPTPLAPLPEREPGTASPVFVDAHNISSKFGPASSASIFAIKVLSDKGDGATSDIISGINAAVQHAVASRKPSVVNLSLGGSPSTAIDDAVKTGIGRGIHFTIGQLASRSQ
jgi:subtilisin family serine protease